MKILVVDDDEAIVDYIATCLRAQRHEILTAFSGREGCRMARLHGPEVIILDLMMPDMHGFEVCQLVRKDEALKGCKIIISSGKSYAVDKKAAMSLGADLYLTKPYPPEALLEALREVLSPG
jgi:DNA-binding response OmpR family regulator